MKIARLMSIIVSWVLVLLGTFLAIVGIAPLLAKIHSGKTFSSITIVSAFCMLGLGLAFALYGAYLRGRR